MSKIGMIVLVFLNGWNVIAQDVSKPPLDTSVLGKFPSLANPSISNDGKYVSYIIQNLPFKRSTLVIQSIAGSWKKEMIGVANGYFSDDSRQYVYKSKDSLFSLHLATENKDYRAAILSSKQPAYKKGEWLAYQVKGDAKTIVLYNLLNGKEQRFNNVTEYDFENYGRVMMVKKIVQNEGKLINELIWIDLRSGVVKTIWSSANMNVNDYKVGEYSFDKECEQLVFCLTGKEKNNNSIWLWKDGMKSSILKVSNATTGFEPGYFVSAASAPRFNKTGEYIIFEIEASTDRDRMHRQPSESAKVNIWSYNDSRLQSEQLADLRTGYKYGSEYMSVQVSGNQLLRLNQVGEEVYPFEENDSYVFIMQLLTDTNLRRLVKFLSLKDGLSRQMPHGFKPLTYSPDGHYCVYYNAGEQSYFSYATSTGKSINISKMATRDKKRGSISFNQIAGWKSDGVTLLVYDSNHDIWGLDVQGVKRPIEITNGYGRKNNISFRILKEAESRNGYPDLSSDNILLGGFNEKNKNSGLYRLNLSHRNSLSLLMEGPFALDLNTASDAKGCALWKARDTNVYIIVKQTASEAPNLFATNDFKNFNALTKIAPQYKYNWLTSELVTWKLPTGRQVQGVMYKPENFDSSRKYPVIFYYYELLSDRLNVFKKPQYMSAEINIPWFVSNGYIVFTPDIYYTTGKTGQSALDAVASAAKHLSNLIFVDSKHIGLYGFSFGGYETNFIITRTKMFAAAGAGAGASDFISNYGSLRGAPGAETYVQQGLSFEYGQYRMGKSLWEIPELYIENSPIFKADKVTTPLLIMHNRKDPNVPWAQGVEWFTGLRRLQKKAWMLEYEDGGHGVDGKDAVDYTLRMTQFFDHYLKGRPAPVWMTKGIAAKDKGIITGYELDPGGSCGKDCPVCRKKNNRL